MDKFRITFSTDTQQHYKFDGDDTTVSMVVEAKTFSLAESEANHRLTLLVMKPAGFEIVSVQNVTAIAREDGRIAVKDERD